jgi:transposase-like protein
MFDISKKFDVSINLVKELRKENNITKRHKSKKQYPIELNNQIIEELKQDNLTNTEIADKFNVPRKYISELIKGNNIQRSRVHFGNNDDLIIKDIQEGKLTNQELADKYNITLNAVKLFIKRNNVKKPHNCHRGNKKYSEENIALIIEELKNDKLSIIEIANKFEVSESFVNKVKTDNNIIRTYKPKNSKVAQEIKNQIIEELKNDDLTIQQIANKFGVGKTLVKTLRRENNIERHHKYVASDETKEKLSVISSQSAKKRIAEKFDTKYTKEQILTAIDMLKNGKGMKETSEATTVTLKDLYHIKNRKIYEELTKDIVFPVLKNKEINDEMLENIKNDLIANELTIKEIAQKYKLSTKRITQIKEENNIERTQIYRGQSTNKKIDKKQKEEQTKKIIKQKYTEEQINKVIEMLLKQKPTQEIIKETDIPEHVVRNVRNKKTWLSITKDIEFPKGFKFSCKNCGTEFISIDSKTMYCSIKCKRDYERKLKARTINCEFCGKEFTTCYDTVRFCSTSCAGKYQIITKQMNTQNDMMHSSEYSPFKAKGGKRADLNNQYFRSTWEANIARILVSKNIEYQYEPTYFHIDSIDKFYIPDFYLPKYDLYIEVKGFWFEDGKNKFEGFKEEYPDKKIMLIDKPRYYRIKKKYRKIIANWEE